MVSALLAGAALLLGRLPWLQSHGLGALTLAIALGMRVGNTVCARIAAASEPGVAISKQSLLRWGVVLYGLRLTVKDIADVGLAGVVIDLPVLGSTLALSCWIGRRWLGLDRVTVMLIGAGSAICGAAAVMATAQVLRARAEQVAVAVATVVLFRTLAIGLYPLLFELNGSWHFSAAGQRAFGIYAGSTVHEVAQVVAAAHAIGPQAADTAVITKMVRVIMLAPFLLGLSAWLSRRVRDREGDGLSKARGRLAVPWFALAFMGVVIFNSLHWLPPAGVTLVTELDNVMLATAMAALGLSTRLQALRQAGLRPLLLALALANWLISAGAAVNRCVSWLLP